MNNKQYIGLPIILPLALLPSFTYPLPSSVWTALHTVLGSLLTQHHTMASGITFLMILTLVHRK